MLFNREKYVLTVKLFYFSYDFRETQHFDNNNLPEQLACDIGMASDVAADDDVADIDGADVD